MTINKETLHQIDRDILRAMTLDVKMYFYSFENYCNRSISDIINLNYERSGINYKVTPEIVQAIRSGNPLTN